MFQCTVDQTTLQVTAFQGQSASVKLQASVTKNGAKVVKSTTSHGQVKAKPQHKEAQRLQAAVTRFKYM